MWTEDHDATINSFIKNTLQQVLLIYVDQENGLTLCTSMPTFPVEEIAYFAREEKAHIDPENFIQMVQFGTVRGNYVDGLLRSMHDLYAPTFFGNQTWPDSILCVCVTVFNLGLRARARARARAKARARASG